jgi:hypothetical protein
MASAIDSGLLTDQSRFTERETEIFEPHCKKAETTRENCR